MQRENDILRMMSTERQFPLQVRQFSKSPSQNVCDIRFFQKKNWIFGMSSFFIKKNKCALERRFQNGFRLFFYGHFSICSKILHSLLHTQFINLSLFVMFSICFTFRFVTFTRFDKNQTENHQFFILWIEKHLYTTTAWTWNRLINVNDQL